MIGMIKYHDTWDPLLDTLCRDSAQVCTNCWSMNWETAMEDMMRDGSTAENRAEGRAPTCFLLHSFSQQCSREGDARESDTCWISRRYCGMDPGQQHMQQKLGDYPHMFHARCAWTLFGLPINV